MVAAEPIVNQTPVLWQPSEIAAAQRRTVGVLAASQVLGGLGTGAVVAVGALLAADLATESLSGLSSAGSVIGAALLALPVSRLMERKGRRAGLQLAYLAGVIGTLIVVLGAIVNSFPLAMVGVVLTGGGMAAGLQSRYAATDLSTPQRRGRSLATVVWATTVGSVAGPNLASPTGRVAEEIGVPELAGPYLLTGLMYVVAGVLISLLLRPDPLLTARAIRIEAEEAGAGRANVKRSLAATFAQIRSIPAALLGLVSVVVGHAVMVSIMAMTPVHLQHDGASLEVVGVIISAHITGMYVASPLVGIGVDRYGRRPVMLIGALILLAACAFAGTATGHETVQLGIGLGLLGLGWSCTLIAGSTLLTESVPVEDRPAAQGTTDLLMGIAGASAALLSGVVVGVGSYGLLAIISAVVVAPLVMGALRPSTLRPGTPA
ncbi:MAG: MFS transporter [Chloroflexia bacterium]|nr:MFS transporter [Chloroflexia bacterium]